MILMKSYPRAGAIIFHYDSCTLGYIYIMANKEVSPMLDSLEARLITVLRLVSVV